MGANDRYVIVDSPPAAPGTCILCRSNSRGPFVDTKVNDDYLGAFYICLGCLGDINEAVGKHESISLEERIATRLDEARNEGFIQGVNALRESINDTAALFVDPSLTAMSDLPSVPVIEVPEGVPDDSVGEGTSGDSADSSGKQGSRSAKREGRNDVSSDSGDGPKFDLSGI